MLSLQEGMVSFSSSWKAVFFFLRYCGEMCQKADWESHWQWCQQKVEARSKKEKKGEVKETNRVQPIEEKCRVGRGRESEEGLSRGFEPFPSNSLAFELD